MPVLRLDTIVRILGVAPDLLKIDVEGSEIEVLEGAQSLIEKGIPLVVVEKHKNTNIGISYN